MGVLYSLIPFLVFPIGISGVLTFFDIVPSTFVVFPIEILRFNGGGSLIFPNIFVDLPN